MLISDQKTDPPGLFGLSRPATGTSCRYFAIQSIYLRYRSPFERIPWTWLDLAQSLAQRVSPGDVVTRDDLSMLLEQLQNPASSLFIIYEGRRLHVISGRIEGMYCYWPYNDGIVDLIRLQVGHSSMWPHGFRV